VAAQPALAGGASSRQLRSVTSTSLPPPFAITTLMSGSSSRSVSYCATICSMVVPTS
jgi:hypothetical protein